MEETMERKKRVCDFLIKKPVYVSAGHARELYEMVEKEISLAIQKERNRILNLPIMQEQDESDDEVDNDYWTIRIRNHLRKEILKQISKEL